MDLSAINWLAVLVAALSSFLIGGVWYSPILFAKPWMEDCGLSEADLKQGAPVKIFAGSFVLALIVAFNLAAFLGPDAGLAWGATAGGLAGFGWVAASMGVTYLFERKPLRLFLIDAGYHGVTYVIMGGLLGVWS
ncbi:DUF1761 domain-containing protein [Nannocystaceae bacterium ST9]